MELWAITGAVSGIIAVLGLAFGFGKYASKIDAFWQMRDRLSDSCTKTDALWGMKDDLTATIVKIDTLWQVFIEDNLIGHSNPGGTMLPEELKSEIRALLDNDNYLSQVKEPTLLVINRIGLGKFSEVAKGSNIRLGRVLTEVNSFVFECLRK